MMLIVCEEGSPYSAELVTSVPDETTLHTGDGGRGAQTVSCIKGLHVKDFSNFKKAEIYRNSLFVLRS